MATRTSARKSKRKEAKKLAQSLRQPAQLRLLMTAALALPGLALSSDAFAQSVAEDTTISLGYLEYQDHQRGVQGVNVHSPTLYFKSPVGPRTEIEGGLTYDSVSGASAFNLAARPEAQAPVTPPVVQTPSTPPPCRILNFQTISRASGSSGGGSSSSGGGSSGGSSSNNNNSICSNGVNTSNGGSGSGGSHESDENEEHENDDEHEDGRDDRRPYFLRNIDVQRISSDSLGSFSDQRIAGDIKVTHYFDEFSLGSGIALSTENDYDSFSALIESRMWTPSKNTVLAIGASASFDKVTSSADSSLSESKNTQTFLLGVTQIINPISIVQSNITFASDEGYLSEPYEPGDLRPDSRQAVAWLTRYNLFVDATDAALHLDYRLYRDSWGILSHTLEAAWYQPIYSWLMLRPSLRYYSQSSSDFYVYDPSVSSIENAFFSADQRLSAFGGVTAGLKLVFDVNKNLSTDIGVDYLTQSSSLYLGSSNSGSKRDSLSGEFVFLGLTARF